MQTDFYTSSCPLWRQHTDAQNCFPSPYLSACTLLPGESTGSSGGASGDVPLFTRANTLTVGGNQLDGLLEGRICSLKPYHSRKRIQESPQLAIWGLVRAEGRVGSSNTYGPIRVYTGLESIAN